MRLLLATALVLSACSDDSGTRLDGAVAAAPDIVRTDGAPPDLGVPDQTVVDQAVLDQAVVDQAVADQMLPDQMLPDQGPTGGKVLYFTGSSSSSLTLTQVNNDGTGKMAVPGLPNPMDPYFPYVYGRRREYACVNRNRPMPLVHVNANFRPTSLPGNLGQMWHYIETGTNAGALAMTSPSAT